MKLSDEESDFVRHIETFRQTDTVINWVVGIVASSIFVGIVFLIIYGG
jgi:hypothetical protein